MKVLLCHPGTQYSYQLAKQLYKRNLLYQFRTGFAISGAGSLHSLVNLAGTKIRNKVSNRIIDEVPGPHIKNSPLLEWTALRNLGKGMPSEDVFYKRNKEFQEKIPDTVLKNSDVVIGFDSSSWILAERCKKLGIRFILDVSIAHPGSKRTVYQKLKTNFPEWGFAVDDKSDYLIDLENRELRLASQIVVASSFTKKTLIENGIDEERITVNQYGVDADTFAFNSFKTNKNVNFLFVGKVDVRKGIPLLLETWKKISHPNAILNLVGPVSPEVRALINGYENVNVIGKIPFKELPSVFSQNHVFVFPSFFEGFGLVILEAMACGLPVITTAATCAPDVMKNDKEGFIIDPYKMSQLEMAMRFFIDNPDKIREMGAASRKRSEEFSWNAYGDRWEETIRNYTI